MSPHDPAFRHPRRGDGKANDPVDFENDDVADDDIVEDDLDNDHFDNVDTRGDSNGRSNAEAVSESLEAALHGEDLREGARPPGAEHESPISLCAKQEKKSYWCIF